LPDVRQALAVSGLSRSAPRCPSEVGRSFSYSDARPPDGHDAPRRVLEGVVDASPGRPPPPVANGFMERAMLMASARWAGFSVPEA